MGLQLNGGLLPWPTGPKPPPTVVDGPGGTLTDANAVGIGGAANGEYAYSPARCM